MRKVLLAILMIIFIVIMAFTMKDGFEIGSFKVLGFQEIEKQNDELTGLIADANAKKEEYQSSLDLLESDAVTMSKAKKEYLDLVNVSTDSDIQQALQTKTYTIEYLWSKVGNYAEKEGIKLKMDLVGSTIGGSGYRNLNFTLDGNYLSIINYISDIENDSELDFTIDNFSMTKNNARFTVKDIKIDESETLSSSPTYETSGISANSQNVDNTNNVNDTNNTNTTNP